MEEDGNRDPQVGPISKEEMVSMFGSELPQEAVELFFSCPDSWTIAEYRSELRRLAREKQESPPVDSN